MTRQREKEWDKWFLGMADYIATASKDPSTKVGALIVNPDKTPVSWGYNGFPRRCDDSPDLYADRNIKYSRIIHAELNAILNARGQDLNGCFLYCTHMPCEKCAAAIVQVGIRKVITRRPSPEMLERWKDSFAVANQLFVEGWVLTEFVE